MSRPRLLVICGPTASGKTRLALNLAEYLPVEVVSADSRQVYRGMDVGTAKATPGERDAVPHHVIDVVDPDQSFNAADFVNLARPIIDQIVARGRLPLVVGGTGLYIDALVYGLVEAPPADRSLRAELESDELRQGAGTLYRRLTQCDPLTAQRLHPNDLVRIVRGLEVFLLTGQPLSSLQRSHASQLSSYESIWIGTEMAREILYRRIAERTVAMFDSGLAEEVDTLLRRGFDRNLKTMQTIGYRQAAEFLSGEIERAAAVESTCQETRRYAKRQLTWFRKKKSIIWFDSEKEFDKILEIAQRLHLE